MGLIVNTVACGMIGTSSSGTITQEKEENTAQNIPDESFLVPLSQSSMNVKLGNIAKADNVYVGLKYVRTMDYIPGASSILNGEIKEGHELLVAYFEVYNASNKTIVIRDSDIIMYTDSIQASDPDTVFYMRADGFKLLNSYELLPQTEANVCIAYDVLQGWQELKVYYDDATFWTLTQDEVSSEPYVFETIFNVENEKKETNEGDVIYSGEQTITYDGFQIYYENTYYDENKYAVFKFTVKNNEESTLDYEYVGYDMKAYHKNHYIGEADFSLDDNIDGYINVYDVDKIMPDMSAKIYIAFEMDPVDESGDYYMLYDAGYFVSDLKGEVYIK